MWDSFTYLFASIDTRKKGEYKQMQMGARSLCSSSSKSLLKSLFGTKGLLSDIVIR